MGVPGGSMAQDRTPPRNDEIVAVSDEALLKAESFVEAEEGAANRLMGWAGRISTAIAVVMSRNVAISASLQRRGVWQSSQPKVPHSWPSTRMG